MGLFGDRDECGQDGLAQRVEQEGRATILRGAADGADHMAEQTAGDVRLEDHRQAGGGYLARAEFGEGAACRRVADRVGSFELGR